MSIRKKLIMMTTMIFLISGMIVSIIWYRNSVRMINKYLTDFSQAMMGNAYDSMQYVIENISYTVSLVAMNNENIVAPMKENNLIKNSTKKEKDSAYKMIKNDRKIQEFMNSTYGFKDYMSGICIFTLDGQTYRVGAVVDDTKHMFDVVQRIDMDKLSQKPLTLFPVQAENKTTNIVRLVPVVKTITDNRGTLQGYVVVFFDYKTIEKIFQSSLPRNSKMQIKNSEGDMVYTNCGLTPLIPSQDRLYNVYHEKEVCNEFLAADGRWLIRMTISAEELMGDINSTMVSSAVIYFVVYVVAIFLVVLVGYQFTKGIKRLSVAMEKVSENNLKTQVVIQGKDEISKMSKIFNDMIIHINQLLNNIEEKERQKREVEMDFLQAQINPHFLSNALNTVCWMADIQNAENISNLTKSIISLLHATMRRGRELIKVAEEMAYIKSYIEIEQCCYVDNFEVYYEIQECTKNLYIPRFLLQPIIENALIHSLLEISDYVGKLGISTSIEGADLIITIYDNGKGMSREMIESLLAKGKDSNTKSFNRIGIHNVNERIRLFFGSDYGLSFESVVDEYTCVLVKLPVIAQPELPALEEYYGEKN